MPRYYQVYTVVQQRLREGEWTAQAPMPTEQEFAASFGVSRVTIRKALSMLEEQRLITRHQGRGTFALPTPRRQSRANFGGFLENVVDFELNTKVRVLFFAKIVLPEDIAAVLGCAAGARGLKIVRVRSDSKSPFSHTTCYLPEPEADLVTEEALGNRTVIAILGAAGVSTATAEQRLSAIVAGVEVGKLLKIEVGAPLISMTRLVRNDQDRPVEFIEALYRPDKYEYRVNLSRDEDNAAPRWIVKN
ncbi:MAG: GntR family transcriptional regulator [Betaproteobacteria bacterium]